MRYHVVLLVLALGCSAADAVTAPPGSPAKPAAPVVDLYVLNGTWTVAGSTPGLSGMKLVLGEGPWELVGGRWTATRLDCGCPVSGAVFGTRRGRPVWLLLAVDGYDIEVDVYGDVYVYGPSVLVEGEMSDPGRIAVEFTMALAGVQGRGEGILSREPR